MSLAAIANGVPITMSNGTTTTSMSFTAPPGMTKSVRAKTAAQYEVVDDLFLLGGQPFSVTNPLLGLSTKTKVRASRPVVLNGAVVSAGGYTGTVSPANCAGAGLDVR